MKQKKFHALLILCMFTLTVCVGGRVVFAENIDPWDDDSRYAYGENVGWLNFEPGSGGGVTVSDTALTGYAWAENIGWINLSPEGQGGVVNDGNGNLSGYAWGENVGWINFDPEHGGVTIDYEGNFDGWAWGENIGWIHFQSTAPVAYKVQTHWPWDSDLDGIPDSVEGTDDPDGDGIPNYLDEDSDGDGISDKVEAGDDPLHPADSDMDGIPDYLDMDSDNDGIPDNVEGSVDSEGDGIPNFRDTDSDGDGIPDSVEAGDDPLHPADSDLDGTPDYLDTDSDNDGMPDGWEDENGLNPILNDANEDPDSDGLTNLDEFNLGTDPQNPDTDNDGMLDGWEDKNGLIPTINDANEDPDSDGLTNLDEFNLGTDPQNPDTDGDGFKDGWEVDAGTDPNDPSSWPQENIDPLGDGSQFAWSENAGWINFEPNQGNGVHVCGNRLIGYAWAENIGWINLSPEGHGGVINDGHGNLSGYAWGENVGWINFAPEHGGVTIDYDGNFDGWAWGENIGWIHFQSTAPVAYKVQTEWLKPIPTWYEDADGDGYGNSEISLVQITQPPGYVSNQDDCDDTDPFTYPGADELCDSKDNDCDGIVPATEIDDDTDGMAECQGDCDDTDPTVYTGAPELCDGIDNDCDGIIPATEIDDDTDGMAECQGDCDDTDPTVYTGAPELCDGIDNDCDGIIPATEIDDDTDGMAECQGDCDDTDPTVYTGAPELCDGIDNDCDGIVPATEIDDDGDGMAECQGDCDDTDPTVYQGAPELCDGIDNDCDGFPNTDEVDADGDGYMVCAGDCDDTNPDIYPGNAKDTFVTYNGDFVVQADDYTVDPPTGEVDLSALLTDSDSLIIEGWNVNFEIYDTEGILVASVSASTDHLGIAHVLQNIPVGVYNVIITFTGDDCFYYSSNSSAVLVVYDPTGGYAIGAGWYMADDEVAGLYGRANFGLNVKYKKEVSTGTLKFLFQTGDINLKSTSIDWLVISEVNAQFKGQGRINGVDGYFFRVIAKDLGVPGIGIDEFDIKIWYGDPDDPDSFLVHNSKNILGGGDIEVFTSNKLKICSEGLDLLSLLQSSNPSEDTSLFGTIPYSLPPQSIYHTLYNNIPSYDISLFSTSSFSRNSIPSWEMSLLGMVPYGYTSGYNLPGMPLYNNTASYYILPLDMSSLGLPFYGMSTFNMLNMQIYNTLNPGLWVNNNDLGGLWGN